MTTAWWILAGFGGLIVWGLILWVAFSLIAAAHRHTPRTTTAGAEEVLDRRLARGEIGLEEYERIHTALQAPASESRDAMPNQPPAATPA